MKVFLLLDLRVCHTEGACIGTVGQVLQTEAILGDIFRSDVRRPGRVLTRLEGTLSGNDLALTSVSHLRSCTLSRRPWLG